MGKKKILVCGATGFIGRNTAETLAEKDDYKVYGTYFNSKPYNNLKIELIKADLRNESDVKKVVKGKDIIVQMAATTSGASDVIYKPYYHVVDNARMNPLIFRAAHEYKVLNVIFPSCTTMYHSSNKPIKETDLDLKKGVPEKYFGVAWMKVFIEKTCEFFSKLGNTKYTVLRHSNIYGPYDKFDLKRSHVFGATMTKVMTATEGDSILVWGTGEEERDLLYVSDVVSFIEKAIDKQETQFDLVNVGLGKSISVSNLVKKIIEISGKKLKIEYDPSKPTIKTKVCLDSTEAKKRFNWEPKVSLEEGIIKTMNWYKENIK